MCWISRTPPQKRIAEENISVLKIIGHEMKSMYRGFQYEFGKEYTDDESLLIENDLGAFHIRKGFHSYLKEKVEAYNNKGIIIVKTLSGIALDGECAVYFQLVDCVIPKGAIYYVNDDGEVVSNKIIIKENVNN